MTTAIISAEGHVVIPEALRERLSLKAGTEVTIDVQGETLVMKRAAPLDSDWRAMRGMCKGSPDLLKDLMDERAAEIAHDEARVKGG